MFMKEFQKKSYQDFDFTVEDTVINSKIYIEIGCILHLYKMGLSLEEIAKIRGISINTCNMLLNRSNEYLKVKQGLNKERRELQRKLHNKKFTKSSQLNYAL